VTVWQGEFVLTPCAPRARSRRVLAGLRIPVSTGCGFRCHKVASLSFDGGYHHLLSEMVMCEIVFPHNNNIARYY